MIKLTTLNNAIYFHIIDEKELNDIYISYTQMYNLIINENTTITIKKAIPKENDKKYNPRPETIAKIYKDKKDYKIKIGIGKEYKPIESINDIAISWETTLENFNDIKNFVAQDFEKYEEYEALRKQLKQKQATNNKIKNIEDF